jgi:hypothetical protein
LPCAADYLGSIEFPVPDHCNPAEFMCAFSDDTFAPSQPPTPNELEFDPSCRLDLINADFEAVHHQGEVLTAWAHGDGARESPPGIVPVSYAQSTGKEQLTTLLKRHSHLILKDPASYAVRVVVNPFSNMFFAVCYIRARELKNTQVFNYMLSMVWLTTIPALTSVVTVYTLHLEVRRRQILEHEIQSWLFALAFAAEPHHPPCTLRFR